MQVAAGREQRRKATPQPRGLAGCSPQPRSIVKRGDSVILNPPVELVDGSKVRARSNTGEPMRGAG
jgi:hypothetical protein